MSLTLDRYKMTTLVWIRCCSNFRDGVNDVTDVTSAVVLSDTKLSSPSDEQRQLAHYRQSLLSSVDNCGFLII